MRPAAASFVSMVGRDTLGSSSPLPPIPDQESRRTPGRWTQTVREVLAEAYEVKGIVGIDWVKSLDCHLAISTLWNTAE